MTHTIVSKTVRNRLMAGQSTQDIITVVDGQSFLNFDKIVITKDRISFFAGDAETFYLEHTARFDLGESVTVGGVKGTVLFFIDDR